MYSSDVPAELDANQPLALSDGSIVTDGGHLIQVQYVDIGKTKLLERPRSLVKATEAKYGLEYSPKIHLSAPHRFRDFGETFIQDEQEGRAHHVDTKETPSPSYVERVREQEAALHALGSKNRNVRGSSTKTRSRSESRTFGRNAWIYCTSIRPSLEERVDWRGHLPGDYDHESAIRQPKRFAQALGLMMADQKGPLGQEAKLTHNNSTKSVHRSQLVFHGPVWYTDDVLEFLKIQTSEPTYWLYPLFLKDSKYRAQREYRFVLHSDTPVQGDYLDLRISGMMLDSLAPLHFKNSVQFEAPSDSQKAPPTQSLKGPTPRTKTATRSRRKAEKIRRTTKLGESVEREEVINREQVITLITESPVEPGGDVTEEPERASAGTAQVSEKESRRVEVKGDLVEAVDLVRKAIVYMDDDDVEDVFHREERTRVGETLRAVERPFRHFSCLSPAAKDALVELARQAHDIDESKEVQAMSACWNSIWAICNLQKEFGDIVRSVDIEQQVFVGLVLGRPEDSGAEGKLLVGPRGTYAFVLKRAPKVLYGRGGDETRTFVFPDEQTRRTFDEFGWTPEGEPNGGETETGPSG